MPLLHFIFKILFTFSEGEEREKEREKQGCLSHASNWGLGPQPRRVP